MARVKRGTTSHYFHKKVLKKAKGYTGRNKNCYRIAKERVEKAGQYNYRDRRVRRRAFRSLWIVRLNAASREVGIKYSELINRLKKVGIAVNRKMLSDIAISEPEVFKNIIAKLK